MVDYKKLCAAIRMCGQSPNTDDCKNCHYNDNFNMKVCIPRMTEDAAKAIEELQAEQEGKA